MSYTCCTYHWVTRKPSSTTTSAFIDRLIGRNHANVIMLLRRLRIDGRVTAAALQHTRLVPPADGNGSAGPQPGPLRSSDIKDLAISTTSSTSYSPTTTTSVPLPVSVS